MRRIRILTAKTLRRRLVATVGAAMIGLTLAAALPGQAQASASGCAYANSCVRVVGAGTFVNNVTGGFDLAVRQSVRGEFNVRGPGFSFWSPVATYWNQSWWHRHTAWGPTFQLNRYLPNGSKVCAQFYDNQRLYNQACETITA
jgi:hypothetical protein